MTVEEYLARVKQMKLTPSKVPNVYLDQHGSTCSVPDPMQYIDRERDLVIEQLEARIKLLSGD